MKKKLATIGLIVLGIVPASSYDLWRGYHEERTIGAALGYAVLGWIVFGIPAFVWLLATRRGKKPDSSRR